jgi:MAP/microtubule affinity-regulating kinase
MAPEVLSGRAKRLGPSIDIWALGVILYVLVCGTLPFTKNSQQSTLSAIIEGSFSYPHIPISNSLRDLLAKMLNIDESRRIRMYEILNHHWVI